MPSNSDTKHLLNCIYCTVKHFWNFYCHSKKQLVLLYTTSASISQNYYHPTTPSQPTNPGISSYAEHCNLNSHLLRLLQLLILLLGQINIRVYICLCYRSFHPRPLLLISIHPLIIACIREQTVLESRCTVPLKTETLES